MSKILITGGAGFIPSSLADGLLKDPANSVILVDNLRTGNIANLPGKDITNCKFIKCDVNVYEDIAEVMLSQNFDYVFHYAALVGVQRTLQNPIDVLNDIKGFENVLRLCKNTAVKKVFFSSSSEVYGEPVEFPQNETTTPLNSRLPYAVVKNVGEAYLKSYHYTYGLEYTVFRFFNTYGIKQSNDFVISKFITAALNNAPITIYGDGSQTRTFCYIHDNIDATLNAFNNDLFTNDTVNLGNDIEISVLMLAEKIIEICGSKSTIINLPPLAEGDMTRRKPDISKMKTLLNRDFTPLTTGLQKIIEHRKSLIK